MEAKKPLFGLISCDGSNYSVSYAKQDGFTRMTTDGYGLDVFNGMPDNLRVIDLRRADSKKVVRLILEVSGIEERDASGIPLESYIKRMREAGAIIRTLKMVRDWEEVTG
jgi:hypothetical protein